MAGAFTNNVKASLQTDTVELVATVSVTVEPGPISNVVVQPATADLQIDGTESFAERVSDEFNNPISDALIFWKAIPGAGTIDSDGRFAAGIKSGSLPRGIQVQAVKGSPRVRRVPISQLSQEPCRPSTCNLLFPSCPRAELYK